MMEITLLYINQLIIKIKHKKIVGKIWSAERPFTVMILDIINDKINTNK
jgi:hypothetical protein